MKPTGSGEKKSRSNGSSAKRRAARTQYAVCVKNGDYPVSLELRKLYSVIPHTQASKAGLVRIVDESGEDYLYPADYFVPVKLPRSVERAVRLAS